MAAVARTWLDKNWIDVRDMSYDDIDTMIMHHDGSYELPSLDAVVDARVAQGEDKVPIAYGMMHRIYELSLVVNKDASPRERVLAIKRLIIKAKHRAHANRISELYVLTDDPFTRMVRKLGFKPAKGDLSLLDI